MKKKKLILFIIAFLVILFISSQLGFKFSQILSNRNEQKEFNETKNEIEQTIGYTEKLQTALNDAIINENFVKNSSIEDLLKRNEAGDYSLSVALNILGTPVAVLESIDSFAISCYTEEKQINDFLSDIKNENTRYNNNSFIQMYWMKETGEAIISWIALNEDKTSEIKIIGLITSQYKDLEDINIPEVKDSSIIYNELGSIKEEIIEKYNPVIFRTQYKLLDCKFVNTLMTNEENKYVWEEYVLKNEYGYLHLNMKDNSFYLVYQEFSNMDLVPIITEEQKLAVTDNILKNDFLILIPNAVISEVFIENGVKHTIYVIRESEEENASLLSFEFVE